MPSIVGPRSTVKTAYLRYYCDTVCKWEKKKDHGLRYFKRLSSRVARRQLARELRRELDEMNNPSKVIWPD